MKFLYKLAFFCALTAAVFHADINAKAQQAATAEEVTRIDTTVSRQGDFYRFIFRSSNPQPFDMLLDGSDLVLDFENPSTIDLGKYTYAGSIIRSVGSSGDSKSHVIRLNAEKARIRRFISDDNSYGFDLFPATSSGQGRTVMMSSLPDGAVITEEQGPPIPLVQRVITFPPEFIGPPSVEHIVKNTRDFVGPPQYDPRIYTVFEVIRSAPPGVIYPEVALDNDSIKISFPLSDIDSAATAAIQNGDTITLLFSTVNKIQLNDMMRNPFFKKASILPDQNYRVLELSLEADKAGNAYQKAFYKDKRAWILEIFSTESEGREFTSNPLDIAAEDRMGDRVITARTRAIGPAAITDKRTGNVIQAFLIRENAIGIPMPREYVDVKILPSMHGLFVEEKSDYVKYHAGERSLTISKLSNLQISDEVIVSEGQAAGRDNTLTKRSGVYLSQSVLPFPAALGIETIKQETLKEEIKADAEAENTEAAPTDTTGLASLEKNEEAPYQENIVKEDLPLSDMDGKDLTDTVLEYIATINSTSGDDKAAAKHRLAEFYFSRGLFAEALGTLQDIKTAHPGYAEMPRVEAALGASQYMTRKFGDALDTFTALLEVTDRNQSFNEILLWKWASRTKYNQSRRNTDDTPVAIDMVSSWDKFMQQYPLGIRYDLGLLYVEERARASKINEARSVLDIISYAGVPERYVNDTTFMRAYIAEKEGNIRLAERLYEQLIKDVNDRKNRARATVELTKFKLLRSRIANKDAIKELLQATVVWRDDYFEMDVLEIIGHLLVNEKDYKNALESWKTVANNFPETRESIFILGKMKQLFIDLFDKGIAYEMPPLETLNLYFGFRELTPSGEVGDRITRKVAQFFITADMMDEAMKIIEHQIKFRSTGDDRAKLALWLSDVNIDNRDLDGAESALHYIREGEANPQMMAEKNYKLAYITAMRGYYDKALDMIKGDFSTEAQKIRTELFWQRENWFGVMHTVESRLDAIRETRPLPLTRKEMNDLHRLMVAYAAQGDNQNLSGLRNEFANRVPSSNDQLLFDYLATGSKYIDYNNFDETVELDDIERFLNDYSYMPTQSWNSVIAIMEPKVSMLTGQAPDMLSRAAKMDVIKLAIAYSMIEPKDEREANEMKKRLNTLARDFKEVRVDRTTLDAFAIFDDKYMPKENDVVFDGKIKLSDIPQFVDYYRRANKLSELNRSIRDKFTN